MIVPMDGAKRVEAVGYLLEEAAHHWDQFTNGAGR